jgi:hypothetical protein
MSVLTVKNLFRLAGRQATGLIASLFESLRVHSPPLGALVLSKKYWGFDTPLLAAG